MYDHVLPEHALGEHQSYKRLQHVPGPKVYALTRFRLAQDALHARSIHTIRGLHQKYGSIVRVGSGQLSFNSLPALRATFDAGSGFQRTPFYRMFHVSRTPNLFSFGSVVDHRNRKKLTSHVYSNQKLMEAQSVDMVKRKMQGFLKMLEHEPESASEISRVCTISPSMQSANLSMVPNLEGRTL